MTASARHWLNQIRKLDLPETVRIMNVCGGHERSISMAGLRGALEAAARAFRHPSGGPDRGRVSESHSARTHGKLSAAAGIRGISAGTDPGQRCRN